MEEQLRLTTNATQVEIAPEQAEPYFKMRDTFALLSESGAVWDIKSYQATTSSMSAQRRKHALTDRRLHSCSETAI